MIDGHEYDRLYEAMILSAAFDANPSTINSEGEKFMSTDYYWLDLEHKELLSDYYTEDHRSYTFLDFGCLRNEKNNRTMAVLLDLLNTRWHGDHVSLMPGYAEKDWIRKDTGNKAFADAGIYCYENAVDNYGFTEAARYYKECEKTVRDQIEGDLKWIKEGYSNDWNEFGIDVEYPYVGLFERQIPDYCYTVNETKKIFFRADDVRIFWYDDPEPFAYNPLPLFLSNYLNDLENPIFGSWVGDTITSTNKIPDASYKQIKRITIRRGYSEILS